MAAISGRSPDLGSLTLFAFLTGCRRGERWDLPVFTTAADYVRRAKQAELSWPPPEDLDDEAPHALLFRAREGSAQDRPLPEWAEVHQEMRRKGVTLMLLWLEYKEANPDGYAYTQFTRLYNAWKRSLDVVMRQDHASSVATSPATSLFASIEKNIPRPASGQLRVQIKVSSEVFSEVYVGVVGGEGRPCHQQQQL